MKDDHYKTLNLSRHASTSEIKSRYKTLAKLYHPDRSGDTEQMSHINSAYAVLKDPLRRFQYNRTNGQAGLGTPEANQSAPTKTASGDHRNIEPIPQLRFQPFRTVSFVAILIITFAILGVFGYVRDVSSPGGKSFGTAPASPAVAAAPKSGSIAHAVQDGQNLLSSAEQDIHSGQTNFDACNNQREKDQQAIAVTQQQIRLTQAQLDESGQYARHGGFLHPDSVATQYDQLHQQLDSELTQYREDMAALGATGDRCS